jgi:outer membrane protein assembly factor BamD
MQPRTIFAAVALVFLATACAGEANSFLRSAPNFYPTAQQNYEKGIKELKEKNWFTAEQYFKHVRQTFGFSRWATLSELGQADCDFGKEKFTEAVDGYKNFIKAHPGNERVLDGYAAYRIGLSYFKEIPGDFFIVPPSYEKDQGPVLDALRELQAFEEQYAESVYVAEARKMIATCVRKLTDHELYVAEFYMKQNHPFAAIGRLEGVIKDYPGAQREPEIMLLLGRTYLKMEKPAEARATFVKLAAQHPEDFRAKKAQLFIDFIDKRYGQKTKL